MTKEGETEKRKVCFLRWHKWEVVHEVSGYLMTSTLWEKGDCGTIHYDVYLERCTRCGKRKMTVSPSTYAKEHRGLRKLRYRWVRFGRR